jgi:hypothetical protein
MNSEIILSQKKILDSLIDWENHISELYTLYSGQSPNAALWRSMAKEEKAHAALLGTLKSYLDKGQLFWNLGHFTEDMIRKNTAFIDEAMRKAKEKFLGEEDLVNVALQIENSLLEAEFYTAVKSESKEFAYVAAALSKATETHIQKLKKIILDQGGSGPKWC